ncbi:AAA family ATPase [Neorhizobium alkalisoli]|uniref:Peptidase M41-like protein n=1 Tax=Neorhizobium alkalisoli TaxID=528178 RepID=A0A561R6G0_9HYPH|nr:AAA family ATPase [Neorhizobium alkalisoli]TWF58202.1 peptidase M41-like protein [Neorhizobium alkalisoli]
MTHPSKSRRTVTMERVAYGLALKVAARVGGGFKKVENGRQVVIALRLPAGSDFQEYVAAANILVSSVEALSRFDVAAPKVGYKGALEAQSVRDDLKRKHFLLVIWPHEYTMPRDVALAADRVVDVEPVRPFHLVSAAKSVADQKVELADARKMLDHPVTDVFAAFRNRRPPAEVLDRLEQPRIVAEPVPQGPYLEELVGYGEAKVWGLSLATDIDAWRAANLEWSDVDRGLLLSGPPGTGKTMFAGAVARSCGAHLVATSVAQWQAAGHLDDTLKAMRRTFEEAIANKPAIVFIDEFDGIGDRTRLVGNEYETYWRQVINLLLELIDGHERLEGVVVIGATNYPTMIDAALRRPGRLDRHIQISLPDHGERKHLSRRYFGDQFSDTEVEMLAAATAGFSGAHFEQAGREARRTARRKDRAVSIVDVLAVLPEPKRIAGHERRMVALHEAGHAVVGVRLGVGVLRTVAVPWEAHAMQPLGFAHFEFDNDLLMSRQGYLDQIAMTLGGRAAEEVILGTAFEGAGAGEGADLHKASDLATRLEVQLGMGESLAYFNLKSPEQRDGLRQANHVVAARVERLLAQEMERSREIVGKFRAAVEQIADILVEKALIDGDEVRRIVWEASQ